MSWVYASQNAAAYATSGDTPIGQRTQQEMPLLLLPNSCAVQYSPLPSSHWLISPFPTHYPLLIDPKFKTCKALQNVAECFTFRPLKKNAGAQCCKPLQWLNMRWLQIFFLLASFARVNAGKQNSKATDTPVCQLHEGHFTSWSCCSCVCPASLWKSHQKSSLLWLVKTVQLKGWMPYTERCCV